MRSATLIWLFAFQIGARADVRKLLLHHLRDNSPRSNVVPGYLVLSSRWSRQNCRKLLASRPFASMTILSSWNKAAPLFVELTENNLQYLIDVCAYQIEVGEKKNTISCLLVMRFTE